MAISKEKIGDLNGIGRWRLTQRILFGTVLWQPEVRETMIPISILNRALIIDEAITKDAEH